MESTIDMAFLRGKGPEANVKEFSLVSDGVLQTFLFKPPYPMHQRGSE